MDFELLKIKLKPRVDSFTIHATYNPINSHPSLNWTKKFRFGVPFWEVFTVYSNNRKATSDKYHIIPLEFIFVDALYGEGWVLQQDGATYVKKWMEDNSVKCMQWLPSSTDIWPTENVWNILKSVLEKKHPQNFMALKEAIVKKPRHEHPQNEVQFDPFNQFGSV